ncbi:MAG: DUF4738 domain-containing protein [Prevotella sp.]|nr:DUF4738 domain-containing protein [Prevotella sp.]
MRYWVFILPVAAVLSFCQCKGGAGSGEPSSDEDAAMLGGVWQSADDDAYVFRVVGDTIFYPDRRLLPVHFRIYRDTIFLDGNNNVTKYVIEKFTPNVLHFRNQSGELVKLHKAQEPVPDVDFYAAEETFLDVNQTFERRDTVVVAADGKRYHCYVQVNPTSYKVVKDNLNNEGMDVGKVYYDNIINVAVYVGATRLYFHDFTKREFSSFVPEEIMPLCILSDVIYQGCDTAGVTFRAQLRVPESASSYVADICISAGGEMSLSAGK